MVILIRYASERTLQTSSTFPWYLKLLGAKAGEKAWMNHPYIRVGVNFVEIGSEVHMGMLSYLTTERVDQNGVSFWPISIGDHASFGQRCVVLSGSSLGKNVTIGAETLIPHDFILTGGGTTFGSPPVQFHSSLSHKERVQQTQNASEGVLASAKRRSTLHRAQSLDVLPRHSEENDTQSSTHKMGRRQDVGKEMFWTYVFLMLTLQALIPIAMGGSYVLIYLGAKLIITDLNFQHLILISPILYLLGSFVLMFLLKGMQSLGGGFSVGTARFFSFKFLYWHLLADMIYFCTSTVLYPSELLGKTDSVLLPGCALRVNLKELTKF